VATHRNKDQCQSSGERASCHGFFSWLSGLLLVMALVSPALAQQPFTFQYFFSISTTSWNSWSKWSTPLRSGQAVRNPARLEANQKARILPWVETPGYC